MTENPLTRRGWKSLYLVGTEPLAGKRPLEAEENRSGLAKVMRVTTKLVFMDFQPLPPLLP